MRHIYKKLVEEHTILQVVTDSFYRISIFRPMLEMISSFCLLDITTYTQSW